MLAEESFFRMNPNQPRARRLRGDRSAILEKTWIDNDDDEEEFDDAGREENEDIKKHDVSAFMVSQKNIRKFQDDMSRRHDGIIPNRVLESHILDTETRSRINDEETSPD